jgi:hypothetical protein
VLASRCFYRWRSQAQGMRDRSAPWGGWCAGCSGTHIASLKRAARTEDCPKHCRVLVVLKSAGKAEHLSYY